MMRDSAAAIGGRRPVNRLLRRVHELQDTVSTMEELPDFRSDPAWLRLPLAKRGLALRRLGAVRDYELEADQGVEAARRHAAAAGISQRLFYALLKAWRQPGGRTIWTFVPYAERKSPPMSKLDPAVEVLLHTEIRRAIEGGKRTPREILAEIAERWPSDRLKLPRDQTLRAHIESAGGLDLIASGPFTLNTGSNPQESAETATLHGEVLVIDHTAPQLFLDAARPTRATLTLAIDLHTATVAGFAIAAGPPTAGSVLAAIDDAQRRTAGNVGGPVRPRLVIAATNGKDWRAMLPELERRGLEATVRWTSRLHRGGPTKRLIGSRIADLELQPRKTHDATAGVDRFDPARHALVTVAEAETVVADAVARMNADRLPEGDILSRIETGD